MNTQWIKESSNLKQGISILNKLDEHKFEQFVQRITVKLKLQQKEIFSEEEQQKLLNIFKISEEELAQAIKTIIYIWKRTIKFIFVPSNLREDLQQLGLASVKAESFVKLWSTETRTMLNELGSDVDKHDSSLEFNWKLNAELSSEYSKKSKIANVYLSLGRDVSDNEIELTHPELYSMFINLESIQHELDLLFM